MHSNIYLFFKNNMRPVTISNSGSIAICSSKIRKRKKVSFSATKIENLFSRAPPKGCFLKQVLSYSDKNRLEFFLARKLIYTKS